MKVQILKFGTPEIFNTDQGSQFTADDFTDALSSRGIRISMDGRGRFLDSIFIERLLGSVKYEGVYFKAYDRSLMLEGNSHPTSSSSMKAPVKSFCCHLLKAAQTTDVLVQDSTVILPSVPSITPAHTIRVGPLAP